MKKKKNIDYEVKHKIDLESVWHVWRQYNEYNSDEKNESDDNDDDDSYYDDDNNDNNDDDNDDTTMQVHTYQAITNFKNLTLRTPPLWQRSLNRSFICISNNWLFQLRLLLSVKSKNREQ